jgi:hypothetical protein
MTDALMPPEMLARLAPEYVTPGVVYLASREAPTGAILTAGAGVFAVARLVETGGAYLGTAASAEAVRDNWSRIEDPADAEAYSAGLGQTQKILAKSSE